MANINPNPERTKNKLLWSNLKTQLNFVDEMMQENAIINRKLSNNIVKTLSNPSQMKNKHLRTPTPSKNGALCAKVNSTWNSVLNKNKTFTSISPTLSSTKKGENYFQIYDPLRTLHFLTTELKTKIDILLPENQVVQKIVENIITNCNRMEQQQLNDKSNVTSNISNPVKIQNLKDQMTLNSPEIKEIDELRNKNESLEKKLRKSTEEKEMLNNERDCQNTELLELKNELNSMKNCVAELESTLNDNANIERETIAKFEHQCKRLQNEIKTLRENASQKRYTNATYVNDLNKKLRESLDQMIVVDKSELECSKQLIFKTLEREKLLILLKQHEAQINAAHCEFHDINELIQQYLSSDHHLQMSIDELLKPHKNKSK